ncbi:MAG TPA: VWA domain-containing protein [Phototrophicaceae bacterium]|nr:VWA domain-containing protein [Phototrophicaceae bacterium]
MVFRFAHPAALLLLLIPLAVLLRMVIRRWRPVFPVLRYSDTRLLADLPVSVRVRFRHLPDSLRLLAWMLLVVALARPQSGNSQELIRGQGIDIVLALDISGSMAALDFAPQNRLAAAQAVISDFIAGREFDQIGLVVFAQDAFQQTPPTLDYRVLQASLAEVQLAPDFGLTDGTAIGLGIAAAGNMLRQSAAASRVIILLTDGANNAGGMGPLTAAQAVAALGIRVYTIGMGKTGQVPFPDAAGNTQLIESDLDELTLQAIAAATGGLYFRAEDLSSLQRIYDQINALERSDVTRQVLVNWQEQAGALLWGVLVLLLGERLLRQTVFQVLP